MSSSAETKRTSKAAEGSSMCFPTAWASSTILCVFKKKDPLHMSERGIDSILYIYKPTTYILNQKKRKRKQYRSLASVLRTSHPKDAKHLKELACVCAAIPRKEKTDTYMFLRTFCSDLYKTPRLVTSVLYLTVYKSYSKITTLHFYV
jgi:hypothetical protein